MRSRWSAALGIGLLLCTVQQGLVPGAVTPGAKETSPNRLEAAWQDLASPDAKKAYRAVWAFVRAGERAVPFLQDRLRPVRAAEAKRKDKDAERDGPARREVRAAEALELLATAEARHLLQRLADGAAEAPRVREAQAALTRLAKRPRPAGAARPVPKVDCFGDPLPAGAVARIGTVRFRDAHAAVVLPDGKTLAACGHGLLHLYDLASGAERPGFPKPIPTGPWQSMAVSRDGGRVAANWNSGKVVMVWELPSGKALHRFDVSGSYSIAGHGLAFSPDGKLLCSGNEVSAHFWDLTTGKEIRKLKHSRFPARTVFSADGKYLAALALGHGAERQGEVTVWNVADGKRLRLQGSSDSFAVFSPDGKTLATFARQKDTLTFWELATGRPRRKISIPHVEFLDAAFSPDGKRFAAVGRPPRDFSTVSAIYLWELRGWEDRPRVLPAPGAEGVAFTPDGNRLACACFDQTIRLLDLASGREVNPRNAPRGAVSSVAYSPDGKMLATVSADQTVRLWDAASGKLLRTLAGHTGYPLKVVFSGDGKWLAAGDLGGMAVVWEVATGAKKTALQHNQSLWHLAFSPDSSLLATQNDDGLVRLWDVARSMVTRQFTAFGDNARGIEFSPDGKWLAEIGLRSTKLRDLTTGKVVKNFQNKTMTSAATLSPDGRTLAVAYLNRTVLWDVLTGKERASIPTSSYSAAGIAFSPDGRLLAVANDAGYTPSTVRIWDLATQVELKPFVGHRNQVRALAFSPDGRRLASASTDATVLIWDVESRRRP